MSMSMSILAVNVHLSVHVHASVYVRVRFCFRASSQETKPPSGISRTPRLVPPTELLRVKLSQRSLMLSKVNALKLF
jgi:hypothetical protein